MLNTSTNLPGPGKLEKVSKFEYFEYMFAQTLKSAISYLYIDLLSDFEPLLGCTNILLIVLPISNIFSPFTHRRVQLVIEEYN